MEPTTPDHSPSDPLDLLADCINRNDGPAWDAFLARFRPLIQRVFAAHSGTASLDEYLEWFPGWFYGRKVHAVYRACLRAQADGRCPDAGTAAAYVENYLANCVVSGKADFFRERRRLAGVPCGAGLSGCTARVLSGGCGSRESRAGATAAGNPRSLPPAVLARTRSPAASRGRMGRPHVGIDADEVHRLIATEAGANQEAEYPLDAGFIGRLLRLTPRADGSFNSIVDQRVRRVRDRLRDLLS